MTNDYHRLKKKISSISYDHKMIRSRKAYDPFVDSATSIHSIDGDGGSGGRWPILFQLDQDSRSRCSLKLSSVLQLLLLVRLISAFFNNIHDCDETFNYLEPIHFLLDNTGLQTWEYSPVYAIRSYAYLWLYAGPLWLLSQLVVVPPLLSFFLIRFGCAIVCAIAETYFYRYGCPWTTTISHPLKSIFPVISFFSLSFPKSVAFVSNSVPKLVAWLWPFNCSVRLCSLPAVPSCLAPCPCTQPSLPTELIYIDIIDLPSWPVDSVFWWVGLLPLFSSKHGLNGRWFHCNQSTDVNWLVDFIFRLPILLDLLISRKRFYFIKWGLFFASVFLVISLFLPNKSWNWSDFSLFFFSKPLDLFDWNRFLLLWKVCFSPSQHCTVQRFHSSRSQSLWNGTVDILCSQFVAEL